MSAQRLVERISFLTALRNFSSSNLRPVRLLEELDAVVQLVGDVVEAVLVHVLVGADADVDVELRHLLDLGDVLVPLGVRAADLGLEDEVGLGELAAVEVLVEVHATPVDAHVGAQVAGEADRLGGVHAFLGELLVMRDGRGVGLAGQRIDVIAEAGGHRVQRPGRAGPAQAAVFLGLGVVLVVLLAQLLGLAPQLEGLGRILVRCTHLFLPSDQNSSSSLSVSSMASIRMRKGPMGLVMSNSRNSVGMPFFSRCSLRSG
jgi:hypothetical protein